MNDEKGMRGDFESVLRMLVSACAQVNNDFKLDARL